MTRLLLLAATLAAVMGSAAAIEPAAAAELAAPVSERRVVPMPDGNLPAEQLQRLHQEGWQLERITDGAAVFTRQPTASRTITGSGIQMERLEDLGIVVLRGDREQTQRIASLLTRLDRATPRPTGKLNELLEERLDVLRQRVSYTEAAFQAGQMTEQSVIEAQNDLIEAQLESATRRADRVALLESRVGNMRRLEEIAQANEDRSEYTMADVLSAKAARLEAEIALVREASTNSGSLRLESSPSAAPPGQPQR